MTADVLDARARNRAHAYQLMELGIEHVSRETFLSSLAPTGKVLQELSSTSSDAPSTSPIPIPSTAGAR